MGESPKPTAFRDHSSSTLLHFSDNFLVPPLSDTLFWMRRLGQEGEGWLLMSHRDLEAEASRILPGSGVTRGPTFGLVPTLLLLWALYPKLGPLWHSCLLF